jgi:hypothetical protein
MLREKECHGYIWHELKGKEGEKKWKSDIWKGWWANTARS